MEIVKSESFESQLFEIAEFIARDSLKRAFDFIDKLDDALCTLETFPYRCRRSIYYDEDNIRDLVFKGYCIPFCIENERIVVLGIVKYRRYEAGLEE